MASTKKNRLDFKVSDAKSLVSECLTLDYFHPEPSGEVAIPVVSTPGEGRLVVAVGGNASGKSFFRRIVQVVCQATKIETIHLSMEGRRGAAYNPGLSFVYGSEEWQSTGENSSETVLGAIRTSQGRDKQHVIFWDEPDIGLSDSWSASVGAEIRNFLKEPPTPLVAAVLVTHSKALLREVLPLNPHFLCFGGDPSTSLSEWLEKPICIRPLAELKEESHKRFKLIQSILNRVKKG